MKKILLTIAGVAASGVILAGCGSSEAPETTATTEQSTTVTTTAAPEATTLETTTAAETTTASTNSEVYKTESSAYDIRINKYATGYLRSDDLEYKNAQDESYEYDIYDNISTHGVEARVDSDMLDFTSVTDFGTTSDGTYYIYGEDDGKYELIAYKYVGPSGDTSSYAKLEMKKNAPFTVQDGVNLLSDEYITFTAK